MPTRILLAESDDVLRASLAEQLQNEGYDVIAAGTGEDARAAAREPLAFAIIGLGETVAAQLREQGLNCPILLVSDSDTQTSQPSISRPFRFSALLARLHALNTHQGAGDGAVVKIGPYTFHPSAKLLQSDSRKVRLTEKETNILKYLYRAGEKPVSREELLAEVWGYNAGVTTHTLETHVYRLRQKIEPEASGAKLLLTEAGGYRLQP
jgi:DNA-binding response OmpR family regulator